ncbi:hypothetical protein VB773_01270 [Haloarculaceae archaeon H-GB2-1]|nr:hypothetical protein [Haloarculaceae archaeon H-GB11]MEA5406345.1 hypothetical protein [Haloarculaceae archaeon H-GB2-1]
MGLVGGSTPFPAWDVVWVVVFFISYGLFSHGLDRLVVGVMRTNAYYAVAPEER